MAPASIVDAATVSVQGVWLLAAGAATRGIEVAPLLARHGLGDALGADVDARVPASAVLRLWAELPELTSLPHFGVWLAELACSAPATSLGARLVHSAPTLGEGLKRLIRFERVFHGVQATTLELDDVVARFVHRPPIGAGPGTRAAVEFAFAWLLGTARCTTAQPLTPTHVAFTHPAPAALDEHRRFFGVPPRFMASENSLELPRAALDLPQRTADPLLGKLVERHAQELAREIPDPAAVSGGPAARIRQLLARSLTLGEAETATLAAVAGQLRMPGRTLQRRLAAEGTSFATLLDEVRRDLALRHLAEPSTSVAEVAFALGFADQTAFHRAFVRWTGRTPGDHRKRLASEAKPS